MLSSDKTGLLLSFLGGLPGPIASRLAMAVEVDKLLEGKSLPHEDILSGLRPILRREHYDRTPTPLRLFCRPFEDLLDNRPRLAKQKGCIARASLVPVWSWLSHTVIPAETAAYVKDCKALILAHRSDAAMTRAREFWPLAAAAIGRALGDPAGAKKALGDALTLEDAGEMALLLSAGEAIEKIGEALPRPVISFTEPLVWAVREIYDALTQSQADVASYVAVIVMNRLARPWEALRLPMLVTRKNDETLISKTDMGLVGEILFARMEMLKASIQATRHPLFDAEQLMEEARAFADLSSHIVKEIELKREGEWGKKLLAERVMIGKVMEGFMDRALREVPAALPTHKATGADFSRAPAAEKHEMALRYARLVAGSRNFAAAASFAAKQKTAYEDLCAMLKRYNEDLVKELKAAHPDRIEIANAQYELCLRLTAVLFSEEEAELLRRRGRAALAQAA
jgi:hypothetical protein